ncbi:cuticlin 2-like [Herpailurus yagouaroundi]|uniref:cuticlin 2-like n=1 Tax=Herpailurus yagouaroundi TaxID=1608482 RepID=UPI001AD73F5F|nr:cuticlin 2-like [Puma yagouaroundi]
MAVPSASAQASAGGGICEAKLATPPSPGIGCVPAPPGTHVRRDWEAPSLSSLRGRCNGDYFPRRRHGCAAPRLPTTGLARNRPPPAGAQSRRAPARPARAAARGPLSGGPSVRRRGPGTRRAAVRRGSGGLGARSGRRAGVAQAPTLPLRRVPQTRPDPAGSPRAVPLSVPLAVSGAGGASAPPPSRGGPRSGWAGHYRGGPGV